MNRNVREWRIECSQCKLLTIPEFIAHRNPPANVYICRTCITAPPWDTKYYRDKLKRWADE